MYNTNDVSLNAQVNINVNNGNSSITLLHHILLFKVLSQHYISILLFFVWQCEKLAQGPSSRISSLWILK